MKKDQSQQEKSAAAGAARDEATKARKAADDAGGNDAELNKKADAAEAEATRLEEAAKAPSHDTRSERKGPSNDTPTSEKIRKRMQILSSDLRAALIAEGKDPDEMTDDEIRVARDAHDDDDEPITRGQLREMEKAQAQQTAEKMVESIQDADVRTAVLEALRTRVAQGGTPEQRYADALAIVNSSKNKKVIEEARRMGGYAPRRHASGGGAPAKDSDDDFQPTAVEASMMRIGKLSKEDVLKAREVAQEMFGSK